MRLSPLGFLPRVFHTKMALNVMLMALAFSVVSFDSAQAQREPTLPAPLQALRDEGAQMRYLGENEGMQGWIAIRGGQEQYFYVIPQSNAFVSGLMFDKEGRNITVRQVFELQQESGADTLALFAEEEELAGNNTAMAQDLAENQEFRTPSEQLYYDIENSNWVALGKDDAPVIYSFIDPQCPHCHELIKDLRANYIENGLVQVRMIPVGFRPETRAQAAFLMAVPNPQRRFYQQLEGDAQALPITADINQQGVERNLSIMQSWRVTGTPFSVYRAKTGEVKIVQGRPQSIADLMADLR